MLSQNEIKFSTKCLPKVAIQENVGQSPILVNPTSKLILMGVREKEKINPNWVTGFIDASQKSIVVFGTNLTSTVGIKFTRAQLAIIKLAPYQKSVIIGLILSDG